MKAEQAEEIKVMSNRMVAQGKTLENLRLEQINSGFRSNHEPAPGIVESSLAKRFVCSGSRSAWISGERDSVSRRLVVRLLFSSFLFLLCALPTGLFAQTAHFSGAFRTLGSGFSSPKGVAVDGSGNIFVADASDSVIQEIVAVNGVIPANPTIRSLGSGFNQPDGVAVDVDGNVYVADTGNNAVKEIVAVNGSIPSNPTITTLATGFDHPEGVAVGELRGILVADTGNNAVKELVWLKIGPLPGRYEVNTLGSGFSAPEGVALDGNGNIFVADTGNDAVKEMTSASSYNTINTLEILSLSPTGVAADGSGNVFVATSYAGFGAYLDEIVAVNGSVSAGSNVIGLSSAFSSLNGVAADESGNVFVADAGDSAVKGLLKAADFGSATVGISNSFVIPIYFSFDTGGTLEEFEVVTQGVFSLDFTDAGTGTCGAGFSYPNGSSCTVDVIFKPTAPGLRSGAVQLVGSSGLLATGYVNGTGVGPRVNFLPGQQSTPISGLGKPYGMAADPLSNVYFADSAKNTVTEVIATNGAIRNDLASINLGSGFSGPRGVAIDGDGNVFVADYGNGEVKEMLVLNTFVTPHSVGSGFSAPAAVAVDGNGNVFVADAGDGTVKEILVSNNYATTITIASGFTQPAGIAVDMNENVYVTDYTANAVKEIVAVNGTIPSSPAITTLGSGFNGPWGIAVDINGNVIVADYGNNVVKELVAVDGVIPSSPTINLLGTDWDGPSGVAISGSGIVFVANSNSGTIAELDYATPPSLNFASTALGSISGDSPQSITLINEGNALLNAVPPGLSMPADFKLVPGSGTQPDCTATFSLASGEACNISIEFAPLSPGNPLSEALVLTDNSLNSGGPGATNQSIPLSGIGVAADAPATMLTPAQGVTLGASNVKFTWTAGTGATEYQLWLGLSGPGSSSLFASGWLTTTSATVLTLPSKGATIYARLYSLIGGKVQYVDYTYTETIAGTPATMSSPAQSSTLGTSNVKFTWTAGTGVTEYQLWLGLSGPGSSSLLASGWLTAESTTVLSLPAKGATVYARLYSMVNGKTEYNDYIYTETTAGSPATMLTPTQDSTLGTSNVEFTWTAGTSATEYQLWLGLSGPGSSSLYASGWLTATSTTVPDLPAKGSTVYARLYSLINGAAQYNDYTYAEQ
jgi:sugar lactone lactonase YvrE